MEEDGQPIATAARMTMATMDASTGGGRPWKREEEGGDDGGGGWPAMIVAAASHGCRRQEEEEERRSTTGHGESMNGDYSGEDDDGDYGCFDRRVKTMEEGGRRIPSDHIIIFISSPSKFQHLSYIVFEASRVLFYIIISFTSQKLQVSNMNISFSVCKQAKPLVSFPGLNMGPYTFRHHKEKLVFVIGATGTGKSKLSIDLATHFPAEIVNSDKIQAYKGLDIVTNKVTEEERCGIPHHLLGMVDPDDDFTATDFRHHASLTIESILKKDKVPIIAGGSNSYIESLVHDDAYFLSRYECCFLWVDVSLPILQSFVSDRVDRMVNAGLVEEVRGVFDPNADYSQGIRRAIGVPEMDRFLRAEGNADAETLVQLLNEAIDDVKDNTYKLAVRQLQKIHRLRDFWGWKLHHLDATEVFLNHGEEAEQSWKRLVLDPSTKIVGQFLHQDTRLGNISPAARAPIIGRTLPMKALATTSHYKGWDSGFLVETTY
ncbi:hypothetical protein Dimus_001486 [Dionaea muscipula]